MGLFIVAPWIRVGMVRTALDYSVPGSVDWRAMDLRRIDLGPLDGDSVHGFFEANPQYFVDINGKPPHAGLGREEIEELPPPEMPFTRKYALGFEDGAGDLQTIAMIVSDLHATRV